MPGCGRLSAFAQRFQRIGRIKLAVRAAATHVPLFVQSVVSTSCRRYIIAAFHCAVRVGEDHPGLRAGRYVMVSS